MKNILIKLSEELGENIPLALATIIRTRGSTPQVAGASAIFSFDGLVAGTLGGGILEADAQLRAAGALQDHESCLYDFDLEGDIASEEGAICGGSVTILVDTCRENTRKVLEEYAQSARARQSGVLFTFIGIRTRDKIDVARFWTTDTGLEKIDDRSFLWKYRDEAGRCLEGRNCILLEETDAAIFPGAERTLLFLQPFYALPRLVIAGAGHIGQAVAHLGNLLDFEVTVIDDRSEYCNKERFPDADNLVVSDVAESVRQNQATKDTYYVIVTRGHRNDAAALRACIDSQAAYIGMIGSRNKISLMKKQFLSEGWATQAQLDHLHAPIGIDIRSETVQEIAVSIAAQLVLVRQELNKAGRRPCTREASQITAIILAAGESSRMGQLKLLLPYGDSTIIGTVITNTLDSSAGHVVVVLGAHREEIMKQINDKPLLVVHNPDFAKGMLSSVQAGLRALPAGTGAVMILLADQPMVNREIIDRLVDAYRHTDRGFAIAVHEGKRGHPIIFDRKYVEEILQLDPGNNLHDFTEKHAAEVTGVEAGTSDVLRDIDTIEDYKNEINHRR